MKLAIDAMGGDYAPDHIVPGAVDAAREFGIEMVLVGQPDPVKAILSGLDTRGLAIDVLPASETIGFNEPPVQAVRRKKDSSLVVALRLLKEHQVDGVVSAGSTGAVMAGGLFSVGRIKGVDRPALSTVIPTRNGFAFMLDVGANADAKAENLLQFGIMGSIYVEQVLGVKRPRVALLSLGVEEEKGNKLTKEAYPLLQAAGINFIGNMEARDILEDAADVIVADGFAGSIALKSIEGTASLLMSLIKEAATSSLRSKAGGLLLKPALKRVTTRLDYTEYGGAPLLGLDGAVLKCHGNSKARSFRSGIRVIRDYIQNGCIELIRSELQKAPQVEVTGEA